MIDGIATVVIEWDWVELEFLLRIIISEIVERFRDGPVLFCNKRQSHSTSYRYNDVIDYHKAT